MKLSQKTFEILSNLSNIDNGMTFKLGKNQAIMNKTESVLCSVELQENFPVEFSVYDLGSFLKNIKLVGNPDLEFSEGKVDLKSPNMEVEYYFSSPNLIKFPVKTTLPTDNADFKFFLTPDNLNNIMKLSAVNNLTHVKFSFDNKTGSFVATVHDFKNVQQNKGKISLGKNDKQESPKKSDASVVFSTDNLFKLMPNMTYEVLVVENKYARFYNSDNNMTYFISCEFKKEKTVNDKTEKEKTTFEEEIETW